jgi:hypothetical protein
VKTEKSSLHSHEIESENGLKPPKASAQLFTMAQIMESGRACPACGSKNDIGANRCAACGADLGAIATEDQSDTHFADDDPALRYVDPNNRIELDRFERMDQAELACGLLRSNNIPCEVSSMVIPGLPADLILWVNTRDAEVAWALLADAEREGSRTDNDAA